MLTIITILFIYIIVIPFAYMAINYVMHELGFILNDEELNLNKRFALLSWVGFLGIVISVLINDFKD